MQQQRAAALLILIGVGASLTVAAKSLEWPAAVWLFKPATTVGIIAFAWIRAGGRHARWIPADRRYARWILAGLACSLVGDVLLIPEGLFVAGLVAFLIAHLAYLRALSTDCGFAARRTPFVAVALIAAVIVALLWPGLSAALRPAVLLYVLALGTMCAQALARAAVLGSVEARRAGLGATMFLASDAILAFDRFHTPLAWAPLLVLGTYYAAQSLIAASIEPKQSGGRRQ